MADKARAKDDENKKTNVVEDTCNAQTKIENDFVAKDATTTKNDRKCKREVRKR